MPRLVTSSLEHFAESGLTESRKKNLLRVLQETDLLDGAYVLRNGKKLVSFASNDYLGLSQHPWLKNAAKQAIEKYGTGAGASRYITGNHSLYKILEEKIADYKGFKDACVMGSGYLANIGVIPALAGKGDLILADKLVHSCIIDGAKLSGADFLRFKHNDMENLEEILRKNQGKYKNSLIISEEIFSMDGDKAPIVKLTNLAKKYNSWILLDGAHSLYEKKKYPTENFLLMGTFSKALGGYGGYICGAKKIMDFLRNKMRSGIFTTALPPTIIGASIAALNIIKQDKNLPEMALKQAKLFTKILGLPTAKSAIVPYLIGDEKKTLEYAKKLEEKGFLVAAIRPPTVPKGTARLRFSFSSSHSILMVEKLADNVKGIIK